MENLVQRLRWVTLVPCFYFELHSSNYKKSYHLQPQKQLSGKINCKTSSFSRLWQKQVHYDKKLLKQFPEIITSRRFSFIWQFVTLVIFLVVVLLKACKLSHHFCCWTYMLGTARWSLWVLSTGRVVGSIPASGYFLLLHSLIHATQFKYGTSFHNSAAHLA